MSDALTEKVNSLLYRPEELQAFVHALAADAVGVMAGLKTSAIANKEQTLVTLAAALVTVQADLDALKVKP